MIHSLSERLKEQQLGVELTEAARDYIVENGYDPIYGARPLRRYIQSNVENMIARRIIEGDVHEGTSHDRRRKRKRSVSEVICTPNTGHAVLGVLLYEYSPSL